MYSVVHSAVKLWRFVLQEVKTPTLKEAQVEQKQNLDGTSTSIGLVDPDLSRHL